MKMKRAGKSIAVLFILLCALIGSLVGGYFGYANSINTMTSTDTATLSLYVETYEGPIVIPEETGGSTGLYKKAQIEQPAQMVAEKENPAPIIAQPRTVDYYPLLGFIGLLLAIILLILWKLRLRKERKTAGKRRKR